MDELPQPPSPGLAVADAVSPRPRRAQHWLTSDARTRWPGAFVLRVLMLAAGTITLLLLWSLAARSLSPAILPGPAAVWSRFLQSAGDGTYLPALGTTAEEALVGWAVATTLALPLGYAVGRLRPLEDALAPYLAGSQAMPVVAIAPLLLVWAGFGLLPKIIICALIAFFPVLATTATGVRTVPGDLRDAARVFGASGLSMALWVDIPLAAPTVFAGMKVAAALSVTGAVVGEFVSSDQGLGYLVMFGRTNFDTPLMFVGLISLIGLGAATYAIVSVVERMVIRWED